MSFLKKLFSNSKSTIDNPEQVSHQSQDLSEEEKNRLIDLFVKENYQIDVPDQSDIDPLFEDAARLVVQNQIASTSLLQRRMKLGYNRAGRLMDQLEYAGIVGPNMGSSARDLYIKSEIDLEKHFLPNGFTFKNKMQLFYEQYKGEIEAKKFEYRKQIQEEKIKLEKEEIKKNILEKERKKKLEKEVLRELIEDGSIFNEFSDEQRRRESIPQDMMNRVWNRDGGKCVKCGSQENLEFDHIIPFSKGGATSYSNLQILCKKCNIEKSNNIG